MVWLRAPESVAMTARCTGHCCRRFPLNITMDKLKENAAAFGGDYALILDMIIQLPDAPDDHGPRYTCRHLLASGDCGIYETRPKLCSEFPYGRDCNVEGCTWDAARDGLLELRDGRWVRHLRVDQTAAWSV